jgi:hypothetical protein
MFKRFTNAASGGNQRATHSQVMDSNLPRTATHVNVDLPRRDSRLPNDRVVPGAHTRVVNAITGNDYTYFGQAENSVSAHTSTTKARIRFEFCSADRPERNGNRKLHTDPV